ncbi:hypothetical protein D6821_01910 [Candidatus Parcubacteria bacterium]|nr:MAG: hypothetical protein D6821_01910 [Candidatus Parcubacteria bacterium]
MGNKLNQPEYSFFFQPAPKLADPIERAKEINRQLADYEGPRTTEELSAILKEIEGRYQKAVQWMETVGDQDSVHLIQEAKNQEIQKVKEWFKYFQQLEEQQDNLFHQIKKLSFPNNE